MERSEIQDFAGEVQAGPGKRPRWLTNLSYGLVPWGLFYFIWTAAEGGLEWPNLIFWVLLAFWLGYTPLAVHKKWFTIQM